jgi:hypothetical protein
VIPTGTQSLAEALLRIAHRRPKLRGLVLRLLDVLTIPCAVSVIPAMLDVLATTSPSSYVHSCVIERLSTLGAQALEPTLNRVHGASRTTRISLALILARLAVRDPRVFDVLVGTFREEPLLGASILAEYGDARALPLLAVAISEIEPNGDIDDPMMTLGMLTASYEDIAGALPPEIDAYVELIADRQRTCAARASDWLH